MDIEIEKEASKNEAHPKTEKEEGIIIEDVDDFEEFIQESLSIFPILILNLEKIDNHVKENLEIKLWQEDWDDEDIDEDFAEKLKQELKIR